MKVKIRPSAEGDLAAGFALFKISNYGADFVNTTCVACGDGSCSVRW